ncbi:cobyric acid synthase [Sodalinema gerasimenkoae]|uniref:cobyric acid synthase n=1 Tax=Sodalinema gerasimenkoae TaxID=2862348 RepID=UPI00135B0F46|nr:cobyric acid synthase [Sodalinema gerasimenkoae]
MKAISILGTSSNAGKSWLTTALGAWLYRQGVNVAPFKSQNMSNNSYVTLDGGEIGRAQAAQAFACGRQPQVEMNPVLLKPSGNGISQLVLLGEAKEHIPARLYYRHIETLWQVVAETLDTWQSCCDVLLLEGAGSPVELNLMERDIVNLRPVTYLQGRWLLVGDIERGGIFAQALGTYQLIPPALQGLGLGLVVNKFRGDLGLFAEAGEYFHQHLPKLPYLGTLPYQGNLQPESEDSLCREAEELETGTGEILAWIRFPHLSNSQDSQPWRLDEGVQVKWVQTPQGLQEARLIVLPGSKNTLRDLAWLRETGLATAIVQAHQRGVPVVGICGGYQMLGDWLLDATGVAGDVGRVPGLGLLPVMTEFAPEKSVRQVLAQWQDESWQAYEIHMGQTSPSPRAAGERVDTPLLRANGVAEGMQGDRLLGTYLHGLFESGAMRRYLMDLAGVEGYQPARESWQEVQRQLYDDMAQLMEDYVDLMPIRRYLQL